MNGNVMKDQEFWSLIFLKLKKGRKDQITELFCRIGFPPENLVPPVQFDAILKNLEKDCCIM